MLKFSNLVRTALLTVVFYLVFGTAFLMGEDLSGGPSFIPMYIAVGILCGVILHATYRVYKPVSHEEYFKEVLRLHKSTISFAIFVFIVFFASAIVLNYRYTDGDRNSYPQAKVYLKGEMNVSDNAIALISFLPVWKSEETLYTTQKLYEAKLLTGKSSLTDKEKEVQVNAIADEIAEWKKENKRRRFDGLMFAYLSMLFLNLIIRYGEYKFLVRNNN